MDAIGRIACIGVYTGRGVRDIDALALAVDPLLNLALHLKPHTLLPAPLVVERRAVRRIEDRLTLRTRRGCDQQHLARRRLGLQGSHELLDGRQLVVDLADRCVGGENVVNPE